MYFFVGGGGGVYNLRYHCSSEVSGSSVKIANNSKNKIFAKVGGRIQSHFIHSVVIRLDTPSL